jgi:hypothetical protein
MQNDDIISWSDQTKAEGIRVLYINLWYIQKNYLFSGGDSALDFPRIWMAIKIWNIN